MLRIFALILFFLPTFTNAQTYPVFEDVYINDLAGVIDDADEATIRTQLIALFNDHGIEATVLTIDSRKTYGNSTSIESFATGLFNKWGIGNNERNDGILILIARNDREMRVELGTGYGSDFNFAAGDVTDQNFLPSFRNDMYSQGIRLGTAEVIRRIALPLADGQDKPIAARDETATDKGLDIEKTGFIAVVIGLIGFGIRRKVADFSARFRNCPKCGRRGLRRNRKVMNGATTTTSGSGIRTTTCTYCDYRREQNYTIARRSSSRSSSSRSSFGGGRSSGGGATGRW